MNVQKPTVIHFFSEGVRPAVILYTTLWDAYLNEYLYFFLWKLYLGKNPTADVIAFPDVGFCPKSAPTTEGALGHSAPCLAGSSECQPTSRAKWWHPRQSIQIFWDFSSRTLLPQNLHAHKVCVHRGKRFTTELYRHRPLFCETAL